MLVTHLFTSMSWEMWTFSYLLLLLRLCKLFRTIFWRTWTWLLMITIQAKPSSMFAFWLLSFPLNWVSFLFGLACSIHRKTDSPCSLQEAWKWRLDSNSNDGLVRHCYRAMWFEEQGPILCHSCTAWIMGRVCIWSIQFYTSVLIKAEIIFFSTVVSLPTQSSTWATISQQTSWRFVCLSFGFLWLRVISLVLFSLEVSCDFVAIQDFTVGNGCSLWKEQWLFWLGSGSSFTSLHHQLKQSRGGERSRGLQSEFLIVYSRGVLTEAYRFLNIHYHFAGEKNLSSSTKFFAMIPQRARVINLFLLVSYRRVLIRFLSLSTQCTTDRASIGETFGARWPTLTYGLFTLWVLVLWFKNVWTWRWQALLFYLSWDS